MKKTPEKTSSVLSPKQQVAVLLDVIKDIQDMLENIPSGIDYNADPGNPSPENADSHTAGLIWQMCQEVLGKDK